MPEPIRKGSDFNNTPPQSKNRISDTDLAKLSFGGPAATQSWESVMRHAIISLARAYVIGDLATIKGIRSCFSIDAYRRLSEAIAHHIFNGPKCRDSHLAGEANRAKGNPKLLKELLDSKQTQIDAWRNGEYIGGFIRTINHNEFSQFKFMRLLEVSKK